MSGRDSDNERAIVVAFLRSGHPRMALATVAMRLALRFLTVLCMAGGGWFAATRAPELASHILPGLLG